MFLDPLIRVLRAPLDAVRAKLFGVQSIKGGLAGDVNRLKGVAGEARAAAGGAYGAAGAARSPAAAAPPPTKRGRMGLFSKKPKCLACGQKLHPSWDQCPYCGVPVGQKAPAAAPQRTMAIDAGGAAAAPGTGVGWLVPIEGPQAGELLELRGRAIVGTAADCDVVLSDPSISSRHAEFIAGAGGFRLTDLGSTNGTYVNDKRVTTHDLVDNDTVRLGRTSFKFKALG
jgi:hypothetical protein